MLPWPIRAVRRRILAMMRKMGGFWRLLAWADEIGIDNTLWLIETVEYKYGHLRSIKKGCSVDSEDRPLPWFTYPAIEYLQQLDLSQRSVFEFGAGISSVFFAERAASVTSVENDAGWHSEVASWKKDNLTLLFREEQSRYVGAVSESGTKFDVIVVDGFYRRSCAAAALDCLSDDGFMILDNADWNPETARMIREAGLIQVDFSGLGPANLYAWTTSFFFRRSVQLTTRSGRQPDHPKCGVIQVNDPE